MSDIEIPHAYIFFCSLHRISVQLTDVYIRNRRCEFLLSSPRAEDPRYEPKLEAGAVIEWNITFLTVIRDLHRNWPRALPQDMAVMWRLQPQPLYPLPHA